MTAPLTRVEVAGMEAHDREHAPLMKRGETEHGSCRCCADRNRLIADWRRLDAELDETRQRLRSIADDVIDAHLALEKERAERRRLEAVLARWGASRAISLATIEASVAEGAVDAEAERCYRESLAAPAAEPARYGFDANGSEVHE